MRKNGLLAWIGVPIIFLGLAAGGLVWAARAFDPCSYELIEEQAAPEGQWNAVLYTRNCGATTQMSSNVSLLPPGDAPKGAGNVFTAYATDVALAWEADTHPVMIIRHDPAVEVFRSETEHEGIAVRYDAPASQASLSNR